MSEALSASNVQVFASNVRPTWPRSETCRNTGSGQPVQPVQPFFKSYKINQKSAYTRESSADFLAQKIFNEKTLDRLDGPDTPCFLVPYKGFTLDIGWTHLGRN